MSNFANNNVPNILKQEDDPLLTLHQVADRLNVCYETARKLVKRGVMSSHRRPGCSIRVSQTALNEYLERYTWPAQENNHVSSHLKTGNIGTSVMGEKQSVRSLQTRWRQNNA
ncbi:helix-turn-helix domain-containing protein [Kiloniella sp.]|uniref:helix-turn-helix domain-containing protein n=1 Tax=Kiloniella sp. TaxID=1938587 RepID=UPI003A8D8E5A